jgi:hypothetical protein
MNVLRPSSALKMQASCSFHTSVHFYPTTRRRVPEDGNAASQRRENQFSVVVTLYSPAV